MRVALVTGSSRGIGRATALLLAARGYAVCINYRRSTADAQSLQAEISASGGQAIVVQADVSIEADVVRLFATIDRELGSLTALVNNAGILEPQQRLQDMDAERIERVMSANITS